MRFRIGRILTYLLLSFGALLMLLPFLWMLSTSFKTQSEALKLPPTWIPQHFTLLPFLEVWKKIRFLRYLFVSFIMATVTPSLVLITSTIAAFALSWFQFKGREVIFLLILSLMMIPIPVYVIPLFIIIQKIGWVDTYYALIAPWAVSVFGIFLLRQHFRSIPRELFDAARMDGCGMFRFLTSIIIPLAKPALVTIGVFEVIISWNSFMWPLMVTNSDWMRPVQVGLAYFAQGESTNYPALMAASAIAILPLVVLFFVAQKQIVESYTRSGLKE